jgi:hypothetical protein
MSCAIRSSVVLVKAQVGFDAGAHREMGGAGVQERRGKCLERIVPIMVARNGVHRLCHALKGSQNLAS